MQNLQWHYFPQDNVLQAKQEMGIFIEDINSKNIKKWLEKFSPINYTWNNPMNSIINKIIEIYED